MSTAPYIDDEDDGVETEPTGGGSRLIRWLIVCGLALLFLPLYLLSTTIKEDAAPLQTTLVSIQQTLASTPRPNQGSQDLKATLVQAQKQAIELESVKPTLVANHFDWPAAIMIIGNYDQSVLALTSIVQTETRITLTGQANDEATAMTYAQSLRDAGLFQRVTVQTITLKAALTGTAKTDAPPVDKPAVFTILIELKLSTTPSR
ncbi:MAG: PilN domain-containing protein [Anaerolineae bacterium]|nr:PilN domain-containing protein [Anaerolineae bacterium]